MKLGLVAFVAWSLATITGAMAQCSGTQICGISTAVTNQTSVATFTPTVVKNETFTIGDSATAKPPSPLTNMTITTCQGSPSVCTVPTLAQIAGFFANQTTSPVKCPASTPGAACVGQLPAGWTSGPVSGPDVNGAYTVTFSYSPAGANTTALSGDGAQGNAGVSITSNTAASTSLVGLLNNKMVCVKNTDVSKTGSTPWYNQEWHQAAAPSSTGGQLWDYKMGSGHPVDPSKQIGSWNITTNTAGAGGANCAVSYNYTDGNITFNYNVFQNGTTLTFCQIAPTVGTPTNFSIPSAQVQGPGLVPCN